MDWIVGSMGDTNKVWDMLTEVLNEPLGADPLAPIRDQWGTGPRAARGQRAMMSLTGPPPAWPPPAGGGEQPSQ